MKFFSSDAKLDGKDYTNHSIRATVIQILDTAGFEARHIIKLSSHKNESSIKEYATDCSEDKRKAMFASLSHALKPPVTENKFQNINDNPVLDLPQEMQIEPIDDWDTIDDELLSKIIYDTSVQEKENREVEPKNSTISKPPEDKHIASTSVQNNISKTINNTQRSPFLPDVFSKQQRNN